MAETAAQQAKHFFVSSPCLTVPACPGEAVFLKGLPSRASSDDVYRLFSSLPSLRLAHVVKVAAHQAAYSILVFGERSDADWLVQQVDGCVLEYEGVVHCDRVLSASRPVGFKDLTEVDGDCVLRELFAEGDGIGLEAARATHHQAKLRVWRRDATDARQQQQHTGVEAWAAAEDDQQQQLDIESRQAAAADAAELHAALEQMLLGDAPPANAAAASAAPTAEEAAAEAASHQATAAINAPGSNTGDAQQQQRKRPQRRSRRSSGSSHDRCSGSTTTSAAASTASVSEAGTPTASRSTADLPALAAGSAVAQAGSSDGNHTQVGGMGRADKENMASARSAAAAAGGASSCCQLYVSNLSFRTTEDALWRLFEQYGKLQSVKVPVGFNGNCRGFAFVTLSSAEEARAALGALDKHDLEGRVIRVVPSRTKEAAVDRSGAPRRMARRVVAVA